MYHWISWWSGKFPKSGYYFNLRYDSVYHDIYFLFYQIACCFGSAACSLCCACCPSAKSSTTTRIAYAFMLLLGTIVSCIFLAPGLADKLKDIPALCKAFPYVQDKPKFDCTSIVGYQSVYRICFALSMFFFVMSLICIKVWTGKISHR